MPPASNFRVIIVGGGPIGLTAAHMFSKAGIDYVLLEGRDTVTPEDGSSLALTPQTLRIYDQLGLLEPVSQVNHPLHVKHIVTSNGGLHYNTTYIYDWIAEDHGHPMMMMHRPDLVQTLYNSLSAADKSRILTRKRVVLIVPDEDGITVTCDDSTSFKGSVVIGADGVHSRVRDEMRRLALTQSPSAVVNDEHPFLSTFRCMYGTTSLIPGTMVPGETWGGHGSGFSTQLFVGQDKAWFFIYERLDIPRKTSIRYSAKDAEHYAERLGHLAVTDKLTFKDIYAVKRNCGLTDLEEGTVKRFYWDRIAIVGDAANKQTPNIGNGYNSGVQDLVVLTAAFRSLLDNEPTGTVGTASIKEVLREYETIRLQEAIDTNAKSARATRMQTWSTWFFWLMERYIVPLAKLDRFFFSKIVNAWVSTARVLPFLEENSLQWGKIPWVNFPEAGNHKLVEESS